MTTLSTEEIAQRLEKLTELSLELSSNHDIPLLLEHILRTAQSITHADGGTLYRLSKDKHSLDFYIAINHSLNMYLGGVHGKQVDFASLPLRDASGQANLQAVASYAANYKLAVNIQDVYATDLFNFSATREFDQRQHYRTRSLLTVPMHDHEGELVGVLQLINATEQGQLTSFSVTDQRFIEALASQAAIAITNQHLIAQLENLFTSLVHLINIGIDEKSPHTGRHCQLVPELTMLLAQAVHDADYGRYASFRMTERDRKELWMAGILHDCGKISTPVHVVEKSTKLQTLFDRIALIESRFAALRSQRQCAALARQCELQQQVLQAALEPGALSEALARQQTQLHDELASLDADLALLKRVNQGAERMQQADLEAVARIAQLEWRDASGQIQPILTADELENLSVKAGTLTAAERQVINNHIVITIKMLEALPWPKHLQNVPEFAGGHHERMDGKGYPRGLNASQMSVQARVMAIADIFEALTAKDRPYKVGKTLTESLHILGQFSLNGHIDPDLFDIFVRQRVYLRYAEAYMDPAQIDEVDLQAIPGYTP